MEGECVYPIATADPVIRKENISERYAVHWGKRVGSGTFGSVYQCTRIADNQLLAVKVVKKSVHSMQEVRMHHYLTVHAADHVVNLVDVYENDLEFEDSGEGVRSRHHLLVMELMEGGDLHRRIRDLGNDFTEQRASTIFGEVVRCVAQLHRLNVAHRDIKPENILFPAACKPGTAKLCDFAFAHFDKGYNLRDECGTPEFQAPETQLQGRSPVRRGGAGGCYTKSCDMWSLGAVLFLILSGTLPFEGNSTVEKKLYQQYEFKAAVWDRLSASARQCVCVLLCGPPRNRCTAERLLAHPWVTQEDKDLTTHPLPTSTLKTQNSEFLEGLQALDARNVENRVDVASNRWNSLEHETPTASFGVDAPHTASAPVPAAVPTPRPAPLTTTI